MPGVADSRGVVARLRPGVEQDAQPRGIENVTHQRRALDAREFGRELRTRGSDGQVPVSRLQTARGAPSRGFGEPAFHGAANERPALSAEKILLNGDAEAELEDALVQRGIALLDLPTGSGSSVVHAGIEVFVEAAAHRGGAALHSIKFSERLFFQPVFRRKPRVHSTERKREAAHIRMVET